MHTILIRKFWNELTHLPGRLRTVFFYWGTYLAVFLICSIFFFNDTATTEIYTLSLHDALPISMVRVPFPVQPLNLFPPREIGYQAGCTYPSLGHTPRIRTRHHTHQCPPIVHTMAVREIRRAHV